MRLINEEAFEKVITDRMIEAVEWWRKTPTPEIKNRTDQMVATFCEALLTAKTLPTVDAVEVVRCRDCKNAETEDDDYWCHIFSTWITEHDFCSYGERR